MAALRAAEKVGVPLDLISVGYTYQGFKILLHGLLGHLHALTQAFDRFVADFLREEHHIAAVLPGMATPGQLVRHTQIRVSNWFTAQVQRPERVAIPDLQDMLYKIRNQEHWAPRMPAAYDFRPKPPVVPVAAQVPGAPPTTPTTPATPAGPQDSTPTPANGRGTRISNASYHVDFTPFKALSLPLKSVRDKAAAANKPVPKNQAGTEYCLSFHVNGFCWDNCSRKEDHRAHKAPEHKALVEWCKICYRADGPASA